MPNEVRTRVSAKDDASKTITNVRDLWRKFQKEGSEGVKAGLTAAVAAKGFDLLQDGIRSAIGAMKDAIADASNLNEAVTKTDAVFGNNADEMKSWAKEASDSFGQSQRSALEAAATYGNLFQAFGVGRQEATKMSKSLVELAADLASFNNTSIDDALIALRSGLSGETEPLKRFGIAINDARLKEEALRLGLIETTKGVLPVAIKTQAAYALIMKDSALAQGDFARTSDGLANTQRELEAKLEDTSAALGEKLLPAALDATNAVISLLDAVELLGGKLPETTEGTQDLANTLIDVGQSLPFVGQFLGPLGDAFDDASDQIDAARNTVVDFKDGSIDAVERARLEVKSNARGMVRSFADVGDGARDARRSVVANLDQIVSAFQQARERLENAAQDAADAIYDPIILKGELAALEREKSEQRAIIASKTSTKRQIADARVRLAEIEKNELTTRARLLGFTQAMGKDGRKYLSDLARNYRNSTGEARAAIDRLIRRVIALRYEANLASGALRNTGAGIGDRGGTGGSGYRHSGGPVKNPGSYIVGGPGAEERLTLFPGGGGYVTPIHKGKNTAPMPMAQSGSWGGTGSFSLSVTVNAAPGMSPGQAREIGEALGPAVVTYMQKRRLIPAV